MIERFLNDESGAITVDWVVLTGSLVGLGLAVAAVLGSGLSDASNAMSDDMASVRGSNPFGIAMDLFETDFSSGAAGWMGGNVVTLPGFGDILQIGAGERAELEVEVPENATSATVSFDIIGGDDLSGEPATVFINGDPVAIYSDNHGNITTSTSDIPGITVEVDQSYTNDPVGAGTHGHDSRATYTITIDNPPQGLTVGVGSGADQGVNNEFYGLDDVSVTSS